jgi:predicted ATP-grasp superfamily ATP-dependent carboligase
MRILVVEHLSFSPSDSEQAELADEGFAMLRAVARDLQREPGVDCTAALHPRLSGSLDGVCREWPVPARSERDFIATSASFDGVLLIAPEVHGVGTDWSHRLERGGAKLLSPPSWFVAWAADKIAVSKTLSELSPPTRRADAAVPPDFGLRLVVKPRDGVGGLFTAVVDRHRVGDAVLRVRQSGFMGELIVQPFITGRALSVAVVPRGNRPPIILPAAEQFIDSMTGADGPSIAWLQYRGGRLPAPVGGSLPRIHAAVRSLLAGMPPFHGWFGVDLILSGDGSIVVVDVNPRLTTSYLGYSKAFPGIVARLLLGRETDDDLLALSDHQRGPVAFDTIGRVVGAGQSFQRM